jgi:hypothetical protein
VLDEHEFRIITISRHPLDVLASILHFARFEPETRCWLDGMGGNEDQLQRADPTTVAFTRYCTSERARALLGVSPAWWLAGSGDHPVRRVRYEDLVADPAGGLNEVLHSLGEGAHTDLDDVVRAHELDRARLTSSNQHFWMGKPDYWRTLITAGQCSVIAASHRDVLGVLGYECEADPSLTADVVLSNWRAIARPS